MDINKIHNMDCHEGIKRIPDKSINLIVIDPPYFLGMTHNGKKGCFNDLAICKPFYIQLAQEFKRVLVDDGEFYIFTDWRGYAFYYPVFDSVLPVRNLIVWDKISGRPGLYYGHSHELIIYGCIKNSIPHRESSIWRIKSFSAGAKVTDGEKIHPTQKPVELIKNIILNSSHENDVILDCFMDSGTTAVACIETGRNYIGFELDEGYYRLAAERVEKHQDC